MKGRELSHTSALAAVAGPFIFVAIGLGDPQDPTAGHYVALGIFYFIASFIGIFFNAAVVGAATIRLEGGDPTIGDGLRIAWSKVGKILGWSVVTASVGLLLRAIEERAGFVGRIVVALVGVAWSVVTFFVVPVLLYEPLGVGASVKRSASLFKERWGEQFVGNFSIGVALFLIGLPVIAIAVVIGMVSPFLGILVGVIAFGAIVLAGSTMTGIFNAALYRFATTGQSGAGFSEDDLRGAFRMKQKKGIFGR